MRPEDVIVRLRRHPDLIIGSMEDAYVGKGVIGGYVTSGRQQGSKAAGLLLAYLGGTPMEHLAADDESANVYMFDRSALRDARLILSEYIARNAQILHEEKGFFERNREMLLGLFFVVALLAVITAALLLIALLEANKKLNAVASNVHEDEAIGV
ncbi:MAG: hypothetical protein JXK05_02715 [Campylobacterales bacterium]|nr:hypothetical protein [Campylobacterales bacterium]